MRRSCYDCHSHETTWPWYSHVAPASWLVAHDELDTNDGSGAHAGGNKVTLRVNDYNEVEGILARLREAGATIDEMQLQQADLEDIFIQIMEGHPVR